MSKMYEGYKVMDEMVVDTIVDFAKAYFDNFNQYIELELKNQSDITKIQMDNLNAFQDNLIEIGKIQIENLDGIKSNQRELNNKLDVLIEQNEKLIELLSNNSQTENICPECGNAIPNNSKFCIKCGARF